MRIEFSASRGSRRTRHESGGKTLGGEVGRDVGVPTPGIDAVINVASIVMARDYKAEALRTPDSLGIAERSAAELASL